MFECDHIMDRLSAFARRTSDENQPEAVYDDPGSIITNQYLEPIPYPIQKEGLSKTLSASTEFSHPFSESKANDEDDRRSSQSSESEPGNSINTNPTSQTFWKQEQNGGLANINDWMVPYGYQEVMCQQPIFSVQHDKLKRKKPKQKYREYRTITFKVTAIFCGTLTVLAALVTIFVAVYFGMMAPRRIEH